MVKTRPKARTTRPKKVITWNEAGPEIERRGIDVVRMGRDLWYAYAWKAPAMAKAHGRSALEAVVKLLAKIGGANG